VSVNEDFDTKMSCMLRLTLGYGRSYLCCVMSSKCLI